MNAAADSASGKLSNRGFLLALLQAALALILSALLLGAGYLGFSPLLAEQRAEATREDARPWTFRGKELVARMGRGQAMEDGSLRVVELERGVDHRAIFTRRARFKAEDYPFLEYAISKRHAGEHIYFIWRSASDPEEMHYIPLYDAGDHPTIAMPAKSQDWQGDIVEVGLDIYGDRREPSAIIESISLLSSSPRRLARSIWADWTALRTWMQSSAHFLRGHVLHATLAPTPAVAAWAGLALVLLLGARLLVKGVSLIACLLTVLLPWVSLDLLWQHNLSGQLKETRELFAGKSQHEKHLADREHELYSYAQHLKQQVLPEPGAKIHLVHDSDRRDYRRLKMQYYLLPHNVFNFYRLPRANTLLPGDLILALDEPPGLTYSTETGLLQWRGNSVPVTLLDDTAPGMVYRYEGPGS